MASWTCPICDRTVNGPTKPLPGDRACEDCGGDYPATLRPDQRKVAGPVNLPNDAQIIRKPKAERTKGKPK